MSPKLNSFIISTAVCLSMNAGVSAQTVPMFKNGDKVVLMGDSITHGGHYHSYIWLYYMTRFPDMRIELVNAGMGGECSWDMVERMDADIFGREPSYVTLTFGMNDTGYMDVYRSPKADSLSKLKVNKSLESFHVIEDRLSSAEDLTTVMIGGSPYDEGSKVRIPGLVGKNDAMRKIVDEQKAAAKRHGWGFVDFHDPMIEISRQEQKKDSVFTFNRVDRVHPDCDGQMVMAYLFLKAQGLSGRKVADIVLQAGKHKPIRAENCSLSKIMGGHSGISFDYLANSLPYPVDSISQNGWANKKSARDAMKIVPFMEEFNQERLQVLGLDPGCYHLKIDGEEIAEFTGEQISEGINLADFTNTPQYSQAAKVMYLNEERLQMERRLVEYLWVEYEYLRKAGLMFKDNEDALNHLRQICRKDIFLRASYQWYKQGIHPEIRQAWTDYMYKLIDTIYTVNKPVSRHIEICKD